jgi:two-component system, chemotaxis family, chemotaxis protein CheY
MQIMIVDDSATMRRQISLVLQGAGFEVVEAGDGMDAKAKLDAAPQPRLIVCDVTMPHMSGIELLEVMHADDRLRTIPVVMLTTEARPDLIRRAKTLGAKGWLVKPFRADLLLATVSKLLPAP